MNFTSFTAFCDILVLQSRLENIRCYCNITSVKTCSFTEGTKSSVQLTNTGGSVQPWNCMWWWNFNNYSSLSLRVLWDLTVPGFTTRELYRFGTPKPIGLNHWTKRELRFSSATFCENMYIVIVAAATAATPLFTDPCDKGFQWFIILSKVFIHFIAFIYY
jgi:hypothetical protein